ncbi:NAD(P)/FAD-dependent oxidoreductase [Gordonia sp. (in: high G+C Gram-positive bacteria)]|uniref:NAD(P)/FAD-dependent oxidoreductase n=1 Tax=Gordonia sp. (in: high G+C Gram-positive bacteria) TaxID=84139 RepID=UPI003C795281
MPDVTDVDAFSSAGRVAVIGSGVAGLTAAYLLSQRHRVTVFEADGRLGGHAHTHRLPAADGSEVAVDSGFIVHNDRTYPTLCRLFDQLGVATQETDMSMSVRSELTGLEFAGARGAAGLFPTWRNLTRGRYLLMLAEIKRFHTLARRVLDEPVGGEAADEPLGEFVRRSRLSGYFRDNFLLPLVAAVWSCDEATAERYPARYLFTFLDHHGMLSVYGSPSWRTVTGGSATYVQAVADHVEGRGGRFLFATPVTGVRETGGGVTVTAGGTETAFDAVVIATHPHHALTMLESPTTAQQEVLGAIGYAPKPAVLHTDESLLPRAARARASWNYQIRDDRYEGRSETDPAAVAVTYDMTRLMRLPTGTAASGDSQGPGRARPMPPRYLVTMGRVDLVDPDTVLASMTYEHPVYDTASVAAQRRLPSIDTGVVAFAGAYHGWGFHEDGAAAGARAAERFGGVWPDRVSPDDVGALSRVPS